MKVKANGLTFNCQIDGRKGAPWVIFSNSLMTNLSMWEDQAHALKDDFCVLRYDQRGHGGTEAPEGPYRFDMLGGDVIALMDALKIARAHFVGLSMGGMTAVLLAQKHADRFDRMVPCDCGPASTPQSAQQWAERIAAAKSGGMEALVEPTVTRWCPPEFLKSNKAATDRLRQMIRTTPLNGFIGCAQALSDFDLSPGLASVNRPMLFICGTKDPSFQGCKALHAGVGCSKMLDIEGAGHISNVEQPDIFTRAMKDFLLAR
jgi:3-oxoadipate enol-lactonase